MSNEEKKAIEIVRNINEDDLLNYWEGPEEPYNAIQVILNLIEKQEKIINEIAYDLYLKDDLGEFGESGEEVKEYFYKEYEK